MLFPATRLRKGSDECRQEGRKKEACNSVELTAACRPPAGRLRASSGACGGSAGGLWRPSKEKFFLECRRVWRNARRDAW